MRRDRKKREPLHDNNPGDRKYNSEKKRKRLLGLSSLLVAIATISLLSTIVFENRISSMKQSLDELQYFQDSFFNNLQGASQEHNRALDTKKYIELLIALRVPQDRIDIAKRFLIKQEKLAIYGAYTIAKGGFPEPKAESEWMNLTDFDQLNLLYTKFLAEANELSAKKAGEYRKIKTHMTSTQNLTFWLSIMIAIVNSAGLIVGFWASYISGTKSQNSEEARTNC